MKNKFILAMLLMSVSISGWGMGRKNGDGYDIQPVKKGSAANPNAAYAAPTWGDEPRSVTSAEAKPAKVSKRPSKNAVPDEPAAPASKDPFPEYATPMQTNPALGAAPVKATPTDSLEPPLPDEPGGDPDKRSSK